MEQQLNLHPYAYWSRSTTGTTVPLRDQINQKTVAQWAKNTQCCTLPTLPSAPLALEVSSRPLCLRLKRAREQKNAATLMRPSVYHARMVSRLKEDDTREMMVGCGHW